jgi:chromosome segregation ATPase
LETLKYSVDRTATDLESMRAQYMELSRQAGERTERLNTYQTQRRALQEEVMKKTKGLLSAEERAQEMDELLTIEETNVKRIEKELEKTREKQFKKSQRLFEQKQSNAVLQAELHGSRVASKNLVSNQRKLDEEALKQQEILYTQDFQLQQQERKIGRMQGDRSEEEQTKLNAKFKELESESSRQLHEEALLKNQLKKLQDDLRRVSRSLERSSKGRELLTGRIDEVNLHIDSTQREMKKLIANKQEMMVEENILKLEVKRLREVLFCHADEVHSLERKKLQLHTAMSERTKEIDVHKEMLRAEIKVVESDRQTASAEVHDRFSKIEKLRKRYEILASTMAPPEGEEEQSTTYYVIKAAQEREELQRRGDELDSKIQKSEREIKALENTLKLMNARNTNYRASLTKADVKGEEVAELEQLEGRLQTLMDKFRHKRRDLKDLKEDTKTMSSTLTNLSTNEDVFSTLVEERKRGLGSLQKDIEEQKQKTDRVKKQTVKLQNSLREKKGLSRPTPEEVDLSVRELRGLNLNITQHLSQVGSYHGDLGEPLKQMFAEANIPPPTTPTGSRMSSRPPSSLQSSRSSLSTSRTMSSRGGPTPIQPKALEIGMSPTSSREGLSSRSSTSSVGKKPISSRASSKLSSKQSSRASSRVSLSSRPSSKATLDLSIGPSSTH